LVVEPPTLEFGTVSDEAPLHGRVWIENKGHDPVSISVGATSCGCTAGRLAEGRLAAGQGEWLDITVNPKGKVGEIHQTVLLRATDCPDGIPVRVNATVRPIVEAQPPKVQLGNAKPTATLVISGERPDFRVLGVRCSGVGVSATITSTSGPSEGTRARSEIKISVADPESAPWVGTLDIATNDPRRPVLSVPVRVGEAPDQPPASALFTLTPPGSSATGSFVVPISAGQPQISSIRDADRPGAQIDWRLRFDRGAWRLHVSVPWDVRSPKSVGTLVVREGELEVKVPYRVTVRPAAPRGGGSSGASTSGGQK
jgi:hypothetical protein